MLDKIKHILRRAKPFASPIALLLASLATMIGVYSAYTATTSNEGNAINSKLIQMTDDDGDSPMFTLNDLLPSAPGTTTFASCINITNPGSDPLSRVTLAGEATGGGDIGDIAPFIQVQVQVGSGAAGGTSHSCTGFQASGNATDQYGIAPDTTKTLANLLQTPWDLVQSWAGGTTRSYKIVVEFPNNQTDIDTTSGFSTEFTLSWTGSL